MRSSFELKCLEWGLRRNLQSGSTPLAQHAGVLEEIAEALVYRLNNDDAGVADSIGDAEVFLAQVTSFFGDMSFEECKNSVVCPNPTTEVLLIVAGLLDALGPMERAIELSDYNEVRRQVGIVLHLFNHWVSLIPYTEEECQQMAIADIWHREGMLVRNRFVKLADLTAEQRETYRMLQEQADARYRPSRD